MDSVFASIILIPGITSLVLLMVFTYLHQQSKEGYFRAWQLGWLAYCGYYAVLAWSFAGQVSTPLYVTGKLLQVATVLAVLISTRLLEGEHFHWRWFDGAIAAAGLALAIYSAQFRYSAGLHVSTSVRNHFGVELGMAVVLLVSGVQFFRAGRQRDSVGLKLLAVAVVFWAVLLTSHQFQDLFTTYNSMGNLLGTLPQMLLGISMVIVLYEQERRMVQENTLFFSTLDVDNQHLVSAAELAPSLDKVLQRLARLLRVEQALLCVSEQWRVNLPNVTLGFSKEFAGDIQEQGVSDYLIETAYRRGGLATFRNLATMHEPLPAGAPGRFERLREMMGQQGVRALTAASLQTRDKNFGVLVFPQAPGASFGPSQLRLLMGLSMQIGMTLENHIAIQETQRRTREYELLTQMGQVISSHLNSDEVLLAIYKEIGLLVDTSTFYVAFLEEDHIRFELEVIEGTVQPKRTRKIQNALTEYVIRTGQPLLVRSDLEQVRSRLGASFIPGRPAKSFCGVPIYRDGRSVGIMAAMHYEREYVYSERDVELLQTASGQVAVAVENARLFEEQQRRARYLAFLNNVSKTAISSQDAEQMLEEIVAEIQKNFQFDHIGIGVIDLASKEIEIKAEAGSTRGALGRRIPLGVDIMGRVARTNEIVHVQASRDGHLLGILPDARCVLCLPLNYGDGLLGVLNIESRNEEPITQQDVLILRTLADMLATALHNAFVFQKLQQQSITDGLTGIKTRRFFLEALSGEWKRASRSGRPFSVVMIDLDKFKEVNDSMGHLEGDLVLARVGRLLEQKCRQSNVVARYGGDEFVILMPETGIEQAQILSERLRLWIATDPMLNERHISGSFGVASFPLHGSTVEDIVRVADAGMYVSKHAGGNRVSTAEEFSEGETLAVQRQLIASYIEGFLQREHMGPDSADELVATLKKMCAGLQDDPEPMKEAIIVLSRAAETREGFNAGHGQMVSKYSEAIARELGLNERDVVDVTFAAMVHDVGKIVIPDKLLTKTTPLTEEDYYILKLHPGLSSDIVGCVPGSQHLQNIIKHHHERFDGTGYPDGLQGDQIPLQSRILAVADAFASMVRERPFAASMSVAEASAELEANSGTQFDPNVVSVFLQQVRGEQQMRGEQAARRASR